VRHDLASVRPGKITIRDFRALSRHADGAYPPQQLV